MEDNNMQDILNQVKNVDIGINNMLIPILQDTIRDGNRHNKRMFISYLIIIIILSILLAISIYFIYKQNTQYQEFLSQFEFESEYIQDFDATDGGNISNSTIDVR